MIVINLFGGPGAGKSTAAAAIFSMLGIAVLLLIGGALYVYVPLGWYKLCRKLSKLFKR